MTESDTPQMNPEQQPAPPQLTPPPSPQPAQPSVPPTPGYPEDNDTFQRFIPTKNKPALFGYYCGVFGLIPFLGIPLSIAAIILGLEGLKLHKANPTPGARGHAVTALSLGIFEMTVFAIFLLIVLLAHK